MNVRAHALALLAASSCAPAWSDEPALVTEPRIIALTANPPEAAPGVTVRLTAVAATPEGPAALPVEWSFCRTPKPLAENGAVHSVCVTDILPPVAPPGPAVEAPLPAEGCRLFGPETPPRSGDDPLPRPRDPNSTGGYYQPVRASGVGEVTFASVRLLRDLSSALIEVAVDLRQRYRRNENPPVPEVVASVDGAPVPLDALPPGRPGHP